MLYIDDLQYFLYLEEMALQRARAYRFIGEMEVL